MRAHFIGEAVEGRAPGRPLLGGLEAADDVLQGGGHHKVLLLQTQLFALEKLNQTHTRKGRFISRFLKTQWHLNAYVVIGVEHSGNVLRQIAVQDGLDVISHINCVDTHENTRTV